MKGIYKLAFLAIFQLIYFHAIAEEKLMFVIHMANIGASFPKEACNENWILHNDSLTAVGMRQLYLLGRQLRFRYVETHGVLGDQYNPLQYIVRTPYAERSVADASAFYLNAGLYVAGSGYSLRKVQIDKAVPPVNFTDYKKYQEELRDAALLHYSSSLPIMTLTEEPNYSLEAAQYCNSIKSIKDAYVSNNKTIADLLEKTKNDNNGLLKKLDGICKNYINKVESLDEAMKCRDYVISAYYYAYALKDPLTEEEMNKLNTIYYVKKYLELYGNADIAKIVSYGFLKEIKDFIEDALKDIKKNESDNKRRSMVSYVVFDDNILALLRLLQYSLGDAFIVPFASSLSIEFYKNGTDDMDYLIRITFNDNKVLWEGQSETVSINKFMQWINDTTLSDFNEKCTKEIIDMTKYYIISFVGGGAILIIILITCIFLCKKKPPVADSNAAA